MNHKNQLFFCDKPWRLHIFDQIQNQTLRVMFEFDQYLGFLAFLVILTMGFWLMIFLMAFVPYWIGGSVGELIKEKREARKKAKEEKL